jgi:hypothetical protein
MRLAAIQPPRRRPYFSIASYPYCEQEGVKRQLDGRMSDNVR